MRRYNRCCIIFVGIVLQAYRIHGQLTINMPANNVGNYQETTHLNCTESAFDIAKGYVWYKDGSVIYDSAVPTTGKYRSSHGSTYFTLEITNTALNDNGTYRCNYNFVNVADTLEIQAKGVGVGKLENGDLTITLTRFYPVSTTVSSVVCNAKTFTGTETITADGDLFTIVWTSKNIESNDVKEGCDVNIQSHTTYVIRVDVEYTPGKKCWCLVKCDIPVCVICWIIIIIVVEFIIGAILGCFMYCNGGRYDCFNTEGQLPRFFKILAFSFIFSAVALGIYVDWRCIGRQGNGDEEPRVGKPRNETQSGNPGQKKSETKKDKSKDSVAHIENEQLNQGRQHREQPLPPSEAGATTGTTMRGREDSDGAVSREHVDLQESGRTLKQRPMPDIPRKNERQGHDSKGRGLSANFNDDDHPLIGVNIPTQKAGALEALPEGTGGDGSVKKLKKKKKKSKDQEDEV